MNLSRVVSLAWEMRHQAEEIIGDEIEKHFGEGCYERLTFDDYDTSMELKDARNDLRFPVEFQKQVWSWGFSRCWIVHQDGMETFYWRDNPNPTEEGSRKKSVSAALRKARPVEPGLHPDD